MDDKRRAISGVKSKADSAGAEKWVTRPQVGTGELHRAHVLITDGSDSYQLAQATAGKG
jgi:hypothetical protein